MNIVQEIGTNSGGSTVQTITVTWGVATTTGNLLAGFCGSRRGSVATTAEPWTRADDFQTTLRSIIGNYDLTAAGSDADATWTWNTGSVLASAWAGEMSGHNDSVAPLTDDANVASGTTITVGPTATAGADGRAFCGIFGRDNVLATGYSTNGTNIENHANSGSSFAVDWVDVLSGFTAAITANWTNSTAGVVGVIMLFEDSAGTAHTQNLAGAVTPAGALVKSTSKTLAGGLTPAAALVKAASKLLAGTVTPTGAPVKSASKPLAGGVTPAGSLTKIGAKPLAGAVTPAGALTTVKVAILELAGALAPAGTLARSAAKAAAGTLTPAGAAAKTAGKLLAGTVTPTGTVVRLVSKLLAGAVGLAGAVASVVSGAVETPLGPRGTYRERVRATFRESARGAFRERVRATYRE